MKKLAIIVLTVFLALTANAQTCCGEGGNCCFQPYWYLQLQGGKQLPHTDGLSFNALKSPAFSVNLGRVVTPLVAVRLGIEGKKSKELNPYWTEFKYYTGSFDAMLNVVNLFSKKPSKVFNVYAIGGVGTSWSNAENYAPSKFAPNMRLGAAVEAKVCKAISLSLEYRADNTSKQWDGNTNGSYDWYQSVYLGVAFNFGKKKAHKPAPVAEPVYATRVDTIWYNETTQKTVEVEESIQRAASFTINKSLPVNEQAVSDIVNFVNTHKDSKVAVTGYADKGTGSKRVNMKYSKFRAESAADALKSAGVNADIMTVDWKGDTVQPFAENDANRVAIIEATGIGQKTEPVVTKKYRLEEVRYEVK